MRLFIIRRGLYFECFFCGVEGFGGGEGLGMTGIAGDFGDKVCDESAFVARAGRDFFFGLVMPLHGDAVINVYDESAACAVEVEAPRGGITDW